MPAVSTDQVFQAFIDGSADCYGNGYILNNKVLYLGSKEWPLALWEGDAILINTTQRGELKYSVELANFLSGAGANTQFTTHEHLKHILQDAEANPTQFESLTQRYMDEVRAHNETKGELELQRTENNDLQTQLESAQARNLELFADLNAATTEAQVLRDEVDQLQDEVAQFQNEAPITPES